MTAADSLTVAQVDALALLWGGGLCRERAGWRSKRFKDQLVRHETIGALARAGYCRVVDALEIEGAFVTEKGRKAYRAVMRVRADLEKTLPKNPTAIGA